MVFDTHLHTTFSGDASMSSLDAAKKAQENGLGIIITEHMDIDYPDNPETFVFDLDEYFGQLGELRSDSLLLGIELGLRPECRSRNELIANSQPFDQIIGSIHVVDGVDIYRPQFTRDQAKGAAYGRYMETVLACVKDYAAFDTLGHIDYICRYACYEDPEIRLADFADEWTAICQALIEQGKALEINTRRLDQKPALDALKALYRHYGKLGGKYVTIGSDAHRLTDIGRRLDEAWELAECLELTPVYFKERKLFYDKR